MNNLPIPVLELDDDNHSPCYVTQGGYWSNAEEFMNEVLCKPHTVEYKIKKIILVDLREDIEYKGMGWEEMFGHLEHRPDWKNMSYEKFQKRQDAFDFFCETPKEELYEYYRK